MHGPCISIYKCGKSSLILVLSLLALQKKKCSLNGYQCWRKSTSLASAEMRKSGFKLCAYLDCAVEQ